MSTSQQITARHLAPQAKARYLAWLRHVNDYTDVREVSGERWAGLFRFMFTTAIIVGQIGDMTGYDDRWCYSDAAKARAALNAWDGTGEPLGWHRHPSSGRRVMEDGGMDTFR